MKGLKRLFTGPLNGLLLAFEAEVNHARLQPDIIAYSAAISASGQGFEWNLALQLLADAQHASMHPDIIACNACVSACDKQSR